MNYTFFITLIIVTTSLISCDLKSSEVYNKQHVKQDKKNNSSFDNAIILLNKGGIENIKLAIKELELSAQQGNSEALYNLGTIYQYGKAGQIDYKKALDFYFKSTKLPFWLVNI